MKLDESFCRHFEPGPAIDKACCQLADAINQIKPHLTLPLAQGGNMDVLQLSKSSKRAMGRIAFFMTSLDYEPRSTKVANTTLGPVRVDYATRDGGEKAGEDYASPAGTPRLRPGRTVQDAVDEGEETFTLRASKAVNARIVVGTATGTIEIVKSPEPWYFSY